MKPSYLFIDMDGVIADFNRGACEAHGRPDLYNSPASKGVFYSWDLWGISAEKYWAAIDAREDFWESLHKTPEADAIIEAANKHFDLENIAILTSPSQSQRCVPGKRKWLERHYPTLAGNVIFTSAKQFLAGDRRYLIDDRDSNCESFNANGGEAILVPRPWNKSWGVAQRTDAPTFIPRLVEGGILWALGRTRFKEY